MSYSNHFSGSLFKDDSTEHLFGSSFNPSVLNISLEVASTHQKKLDNLSKQQEHRLFNVHDTVRLFELDIHPPKYVLDTLSMGPKNPILNKFNKK